MAVAIGALALADVHTTGDAASSIARAPAMMVTVIVLPLAHVCLYADLEAAVSFHFWIDFICFALALLVFSR